MAAGAKCLLKSSSNFQSSAMYEGCESTEAEGRSTDSTMMGSSVTACKKVLCSNSVLDSSEYWVRNEKVLCRLGLLEDDMDGSCTTICFLNVDQQKVDYHNDRIVKKLAQVSPDLPKLVESLTVRQPKENEILLLGGLEATDSCQTHTHSHTQGHHQRAAAADVCLLQCTGRRQPARPGSVVFDINKFLIGLQWGQDRQAERGRPAGQRADTADDTSRSISSIEEDFLTASEHLGDDSEDDGYRNEQEKGDMADRLSEIAQHHYIRPGLQKGRLAEHQDSEDIEVTASTASKRRGSQRASVQVRESAGHYATNLAESVLQDAFIRLSQDETSFVSEAAVSVSLSGRPASNGISQTREPSRQRTLSFELPKIVIVQSPDSGEGAAEWPDTSQVPEQDVSTTDRQAPEPRSQPYNRCQREGHPSKPVEVALACAANVIGTITNPQVTEQIMMESASEEETEEELQDPEDKAEYSFSSAMSGMAQVAGAVAVVDLTEETGDSVDSDGESAEVYTASRGLMSVAEASAAFTLHCSVAEGTSIEAFRANIAEALHREAAKVLAQPQGYKSVAHLLEATHNRIVDGITCPKKSYMDETEVDDFISEVADSLFKHALEKAKKKKELEAPGKDVPNIDGFLQDSVNNLLFDILCLTQRKITDISRCNRESVDTQEGDICMRETTKSKVGRETFSQSHLAGYSPPNNENQSSMHRSTDKLPMAHGMKEENYMPVEKINYASSCSAHNKEQQQIFNQGQTRPMSSSAKDCSDQQQNQQGKGVTREPLSEISLSRRGRFGTSSDSRQSSLTPQSSLNSCSSLLSFRMDSETKTPVNCFADDLATTVVSMATELAAIYLENSTGKQPWFCALKGASDGPEAYLLPTCRSALRRKEGQNGSTASKKHRAPRLSEIKRKTEEQPELMERLVNRVVDETVNLDEPQDPFALFASEVTARIMNCPELNVVDTSKPGQPRSRLQCERWSRGKPASYESIPEEHDPSGTPNTLGPGSRLGQNLSRGSSISKQSSCESITDEFSRFMVNQMETEGRGFDLLLDYYAGKNASNILAAAVQQAATKKNGHLNVRTNSCLSKQSSTESISEEFYRFMLRDMDKENKDFGMAKTREWSNSLLPPSPRTAFCIRQSSVPDRRSSDSRLTVNSPIKANSFDGFARNVHGDTLNIYPNISVSATGLCKSDSCLYQRGHSDQITDMLIHETWSSSIESLMRKNKIIADPEDSIELEAAGDSQPHVQQFANRLAADIVETGKSALGNQQQEGAGCSVGWQPRPHTPVGERRRGFKQSRPSCSQSKASQEQAVTGARAGVNDSAARPMRGPRDVPLIHIEADQKDEEKLPVPARTGGLPRDMTPNASAPKCGDKAATGHSSSGRPTVAVAAVGERDKRSMSASSEESTGSWSHVAPEDDPQEETSSFIQLSEGNATSSASSLGLADLDAFSDVPSQSTVICEETEKGHFKRSKEKVIEGSSVGGSSGPRVLLVVNCDLESECVDSELRVALQWIAASELGLPGLYFSKSKEKGASKFQRVVHLVSQKAWRIADLFSAVVQFCKLHEKKEGGRLSSLFDWLLETL